MPWVTRSRREPAAAGQHADAPRRGRQPRWSFPPTANSWRPAAATRSASGEPDHRQTSDDRHHQFCGGDGHHPRRQDAGRRRQAWGTSPLERGDRPADATACRSAHSQVQAMGFSPDGKHLSLVDDQGNVLIKDAATGNNKNVFRTERDYWFRLALSADGKWACSAGHDTPFALGCGDRKTAAQAARSQGPCVWGRLFGGRPLSRLRGPIEPDPSVGAGDRASGLHLAEHRPRPGVLARRPHLGIVAAGTTVPASNFGTWPPANRAVSSPSSASRQSLFLRRPMVGDRRRRRRAPHMGRGHGPAKADRSGAGGGTPHCLPRRRPDTGR